MRSSGDRRGQSPLSNAVRAAATARSMSASVPSGTRPTSSSECGEMTSMVPLPVGLDPLAPDEQLVVLVHGAPPGSRPPRSHQSRTGSTGTPFHGSRSSPQLASFGGGAAPDDPTGRAALVGGSSPRGRRRRPRGPGRLRAPRHAPRRARLRRDLVLVPVEHHRRRGRVPRRRDLLPGADGRSRPRASRPCGPPSSPSSTRSASTATAPSSSPGPCSAPAPSRSPGWSAGGSAARGSGCWPRCWLPCARR